MTKKQIRFTQKIFSLAASFLLLFNSLVPSLVYAEELITEPTPTAEVTPTPETTPTPTTEPTPEITVSPTPQTTPQPTAGTTPTPTQATTPTPTPEPSLTVTPADTTNDEPSSITALVVETQTTQSDLDLDTQTSNSSATLTTDKADYAPTDTVLITADNLQFNTTYKLVISSADQPAIRFETNVSTNNQGSFSYSYQLDGNYRPNYLVELFLGSTLILSTSFTDSYVVGSYLCENDLQGADDEPGQKDLTKMCRDTSSTNPVIINWNWDETSLNGNNSGDGCALFDTDSDTFANYSICATWKQNQQQISSSPRLYSCGDTRTDRCANASLLTISNGSTCTISNSTDNPFTPGNNDTRAACSINLADVGGVGSAALTDVCSYPSQEPNSDPSDCVVASTANDTGTITIIKDLVPSTDSGRFNLQIDGENIVTNVGDAGTTGEIELSAGTHTVGEVAYTGTNLSDYTSTISCSGSQGSTTNAGPLTLDLSRNENIVCTITNTRTTGTLQINKNVDLNNDGDYTDTNESGVANWTWDISGGEQNIATGQSRTLTSGTYTISEDNQTNYHLVNWTCSDGSNGITNSISANVPANGALTCTFNNARDTGNIIVHKDVQGPAGEVVTDISTNFGVSLDGSGEQTLTDGGSVIFSNIPTGSHTITESTLPSTYTLYGITNSGVVNVVTGDNHVYVVNRQKSATLTIVKNVVNPQGQDVTDGHHFTANVGTQSSSFWEGSNATFVLNPGTYTVAESDDTNYTELGCKLPNDTAATNFSLTSGQSLTITCTNQQLPVTITVNKNVLAADGITNVADNNTFSVTLNGESKDFSENTPAVYTVNPGTYSALEAPETNYTFVSNSGPVTLTSNSRASILITNQQNPASITGYKYDATTGLGILGWTIYLNNGTSTTSTLTGADGFYQFVGLNTGNYIVTENQPTGWTTVGITRYDLSLTPGASSSGNIFANFQNIDLSGQKYNDLDGDGTKDAGEPGLPGWTIQLQNTSGVVIGTQVTDSNGNYIFADKGPGTYRLREVTQAGWMQTSSNPADITAASGQDVTGINFGNFNYGHISGHKFNDLNRNGVWDKVTTDDLADEPAIEGWRIYLQKPNGSVVSNLTSSTGYYNFSNLGPGSYIVYEENQTGWDQTAPNDDRYIIEMTSDGDFQDKDFGNFHIQPAISIEKLLSTTTNPEILVGQTATFTIKVINSGNVTLLNPTVYDTYDASFLEFLSSTPVSPANHFAAVADTADYDGDLNKTELVRDLVWTLPTSLAPGASYILTLNFKALHLTPDAPVQTFTGNEAYATACYEQCAQGQSLTTPTDAAVVDVDALGSVSGQKFTDLNGNGLWDSGEPTKNGVTINLLNGQITTPTTTTGNGDYSFTGLATGNYTICETVPSGYVQTYPTNNTCHAIAITDDGETLTGRNFGNFQLGQISGYKWNDLDGDGIWDTGESPLRDWPINFGSLSTTTNASGYYQFTNLTAGTFALTENPQGWLPTASPTSPVTVISGLNLTNQNFGNHGYGQIRARKLIDADGDLRTSDDQSPASGWSFDVTALSANASANVPNLTTDATGQSLAETVLTGQYTIIEDVQAGYELLGATCGNGSGTFATFDRLTAVSVGIDETVTCTFINARDTGSIDVYKTIDMDGDLNTTQDRILGVDWQFDVDGWTGDTTDAAAQETDSTGHTLFTDLKTGQYTVIETVQPGFEILSASCDTQNGTYDRTDSVDRITVAKDDTVECVFVNHPTSTLHGYKWNDINGNGTKGLGDDLLSGWTINLYQSDGDGYSTTPFQTKVTSNTQEHLGWYWFENLLPGNYKICEVAQTGWTQTFPTLLNLPTCHYVSLPDGNSGNFPVESNYTAAAPVYNFGNYAQPELNITKSNDQTGVTLSEGSLITYTLTISNPSQVTLTNVIITDAAPSADLFEFVTSSLAPASTNPFVWNIGDLTPESEFTITYQLKVKAGVTPGTYTNFAYASGTLKDESTLTTDIVDSAVQVGSVNNLSAGSTTTGQVLGAVLGAATGSSTLWLILALVFMISGGALKLVAKKHE